MFENFLFRSILKFLYYWNENTYFPLYSNPPTHLNFAFPDFSVQYFIMSIPPNRKTTIEGKIPFDKVKYFSISVYDTNGSVVLCKNHTQLAENYKFDLHPKTRQCLVLRFYRKKAFLREDFYSYLPKTFPKRKQLPMQKIQKSNRTVEEKLVYYIRHKNKSLEKLIPFRDLFYLPAKHHVKSFFINQDATYLIVFPSTRIGKITWKLTKMPTNVKYLGYIVCDFLTTRTDDCIEVHAKKNKTQTLWVCYDTDIHLLKKYGRKPSDGLICWKPTTTTPVVIMRQVHTSETKLSSMNNKTTNIHGEQLQSIMGDAYPKIECF